ncbi:RNA polymerase, phage-associated [Yersinia phage phiR8-01]|uniref:DNA-directed RNA polymerase n=1 Tax=Yersinia phage phiR8-01 TaxID=1206556 RepID=I7K2I6_9CAUD|nr:RNA polymerase, phage-associated [Yersinia phage phiR8-01]CCI88411.2 RNA polymerase, phage-associated [Yersinia phage phiR8-01]
MITLEQQLAWEHKHRELGRDKVMESLRKAEEQGRVTDTPLGTGVLRKYIMWLSQRIATDLTVDLGKPGRSKAHSPLLKDLDPDSVALITISSVINTLSQDNRGLSAVAMQIGKTIYGELALCYFRDMKEDLYEAMVHDLTKKMSKDLRHRLTVMRMQAEKAGVSIPEWTPSQKLQVGLYLLSLIDGEDGLVEQYTDFTNKKTTYKLQLRPAVMQLMNSAESSILAHAGFAAPCLIQPQDWDGDGVGGFYGDLKIRAPRFFKGDSYQMEVMKKLGCDLRVVLGMLNAHQSVAWKVNPFILDLVKGMRLRGYETDDVMFTSAHPEPPRPLFLDLADKIGMTVPQEVEFKQWKQTKRDWHTKIRLVSRAEAKLSRVIYAAQDMLEYSEFFFVFQTDDRGRMYPVSGPLNPQGSDMQKAMLHAAHGEPIADKVAEKWFKLNLATKYGVDKLNIDQCVQWTIDNHDNIMRAAEDPLNRDAFYWWSEADKPLQFIALCDEYRRYHLDPVNFVARIAVAMDGTCNGLQNYSALLRDEVGGRATNLIGEDGDAPNDIYGDVAVAAEKRLQYAEECAAKLAWLKEGFNRGLTKKSVMTQVYGSTFGTCRKSIVAYCVEKALFEDKERWEFADFASHLVWEGIGDVVVKGKEAMDWLRKVSGCAMKTGDDYISWPAPSGFRVVQVYRKSEVKRVQAQVGNKITLRLREETDLPDKIRHRNATPPNFIHSVDASHMAFVSVRMYLMFPGLFMHMIHDDFGALPSKAQALYDTIRSEFVQMHENYSLDCFVSEYGHRVKLPPVPERGSLDIRCVLTSPNFFR